MLRARTGLLIMLFAVLTACQTGSPAANQSLKTNKKPVDAVVTIARIAQNCWFKSKDPAFKNTRMSNEVNSPAGRPRILLVKKNDPNGLPLLVIQAEKRGDVASGIHTNIETFGPLLQSRNGKRIVDDVRRWSKGNKDCRAS